MVGYIMQNYKNRIDLADKSLFVDKILLFWPAFNPLSHCFITNKSVIRSTF